MEKRKRILKAKLKQSKVEMESLCLFINNNKNYNNTLTHVVRQNQNEITNLDDMRATMFRILDRSKITNLVMYPANFGIDEKIIISFKFEGRSCEVKEFIRFGFDYDDLSLNMSPAVI